jgi:hypothetical protein
MAVSLMPLQSGAVASSSFSSVGVPATGSGFSTLVSQPGSTIGQYNADIAALAEANRQLWERVRGQQSQGAQGSYQGMGTSAANDSMALAEMSRQSAEMLRVQIAMQRENMMFSSISNILKTKHDTLKNTISNIR